MTALEAGTPPVSQVADGAPSDDGLEVHALDHEGQGVARRGDGKVVFIEGALPFERVRIDVARGKKQWEQGVVAAILQPSSQRVNPRCTHFGLHRGAWAIEAFARALKRFKTSKGAIQIPLEHEVPLYRVSRLIAFDLPAVPSATKRPGTRRSGGAR